MKKIQNISFFALTILVFLSTIILTPASASASAVPTCVFNTIVQPFNNGGTTLSWGTNNASDVNITGIGSVSFNDAMVVYPNSITDYTLTATGLGGESSCTVTVFPPSVYANGGANGVQGYNQTCNMWVNPDLVVPNGTGVLSWDAGSATTATINRGIGDVSNRGTRVIPNIGTPETFTMTTQLRSGATRTCDATLFPTTNTVLNANTTNPNVYASGVSSTITPLQYVMINQVPYTGVNDMWYALTLFGIAFTSFSLIYIRRKSLLAILLK